MITPLLFAISILAAFVLGAVCAVLGAWIYHCARSGRSPMPVMFPAKPEPEVPMVAPPKAKL